MKQKYQRHIQRSMASTISHYASNSQDFWEGTRHHDVSQNIDALCRNLPVSDSPLKILDFGCGPGRDLKFLTDLGHTAVGLDGCAEFCQMARAYSGCEVYHQNFIDLNLPLAAFKGIFANASLFHIHKAHLDMVLKTFHSSLTEGGVVFCSNPRGPNIEQMNGLRYGNYMDVSGWSEVFLRAQFELIEQYFRPTGLPREAQPWLAMVWKKKEII